MTPKADLWDRKLQAFLLTLSNAAPLSAKDEQRQVAELVATALGINVSGGDETTLAQTANKMAAGIDDKAFVSDYSISDSILPPMTIHPLSGEIALTDEWQKVSISDRSILQRRLQQAIETIRQEVAPQPNNLDPQKLFLALWRRLPEMVRLTKDPTGDSALGELWDLLPADPRVPTYTVWDRAAVASAIAGTLPDDPALLLFTLASLPQFNANARLM